MPGITVASSPGFAGLAAAVCDFATAKQLLFAEGRRADHTLRA